MSDPDRRQGFRKMAGAVKRRASRVGQFLAWVGTDVARDPGFALYTRRQGRTNHAFFLEQKARRPEEERAFLARYDIPDMPRIIWIYWHQGEASAPFLVRRCIETWRSRNPGWEVRVLDFHSAQAYADMSDVPTGLSLTYTADLLRVRLMRDHGGVWTDATTYCHRPLDDWLWMHLTGGFFVFRNAGPDRMIENWFIASVPGHILARHWADDATRYLQRNPQGSSHYFIFFYILQWRLARDPEARAAFDQLAGLPALPALTMMESMKGIVPPEQIARLVRSGLPLSKLSRHSPLETAAIDRFFAEIDRVAPRPAQGDASAAASGHGGARGEQAPAAPRAGYSRRNPGIA